jgi:hypothetical protein
VAVAESQAQVGIQVYGSVRLLIERALVGPAAETVLSTGHPTPPHWRHRAHQQQLAGSAGEAPDTLRIEATAHLEMTSRLRPQVKRQRALPASMRQWLVEAGAPC